MSSNNDLSHVTSRFFDLFSSRAFSNATRSLPMAPVRAHWIRNVSTRQRHGPPPKKWFYSGIWVVSRQIQLHPLPGCTGQALLIQQLPAGASATVVAASSSCSLEPLEPFTLKLASFTSNVTYWRKSKKIWTFAPGFLEYFSAIFSRYFLLGRWTKTPAALQVKTNKLLWWGKTIPTQKWLDKMCMLENYVAYINANNFAYDFSALDLQYLIPCVCSIKHTAQQKLCICS